MRLMSFFLLMIILASCGKKSGGGSESHHETQNPGNCCDAQEIEIDQNVQKLNALWDRLEKAKSHNWSIHAPILGRSIFFGQQIEAMATKELKEKDLGEIFITFTQSVDNGEKPDMKELAIKLIKTKD